MKVVVLTNILAPYRIPLFERIREKVEEFTVLLMAGTEDNRQWVVPDGNFNKVVLPGFHPRLPGRDVAFHLNIGVIQRLRHLNPDVVLSGGFAPANLAAFLYCRMYGKLNVAWGHLTLKDGADRSGIRRWLRRVMIRQSAGCIGESSEAAQAFVHYGAKTERVLTALMPFDTDHFHFGAAQFRQDNRRKVMRARFRGSVLLAIGQLISRKGYEQLFHIYERVLDQVAPVSLLILGDGPERQRYEQWTRERGWMDVHFLGYIQSDEVPRYMALADVFVFPTLYDPYGLVLAEAMAAELPVVSSVHAASTHDLVVEGITGFRIDPLKADASAGTLSRVLRMTPTERREMGRSAYEKICPCDVRESAEAIVRFLYILTGQSRVRHSPEAARCGTCV